MIGNPSCHNPSGFGYTLLAANQNTHTGIGSPVYTVQQLRNLVGNTFHVGIDVNSNTTPMAREVLDSFSLVIAGATQFIFNSPTQLAVYNNGNGWSDAVLSGFDISAFAGSATAQFFLTYHNAVAGREQFFLVARAPDNPPPTPLPSPGSLTLLGLGLIVLAGYAGARNAKIAS